MVKHLNSTKEKIQILLEKLLDEYNLGSKKDNVISLQMDNFLSDTNFDRVFFLKVLTNLKERRVVTSFLLRKGSKVRHSSDDKQDFDTCGIAISENFEKDIEKYLKEISVDLANSSSFRICLDTNGNLWHTDINKFCYPIEKGSARLKFIKYLIENKGYQDTSKLADILNKKDQDVRTEKSKINKMVKNFLDLPDFIKNGGNLGGYGINPEYKTMISK